MSALCRWCFLTGFINFAFEQRFLDLCVKLRRIYSHLTDSYILMSKNSYYRITLRIFDSPNIHTVFQHFFFNLLFWSIQGGRLSNLKRNFSKQHFWIFFKCFFQRNSGDHTAKYFVGIHQNYCIESSIGILTSHSIQSKLNRIIWIECQM